MNALGLSTAALSRTLTAGYGAGGAVYVASDGSEQYGLASLPAGASISQPFAVINARLYTLHLAVKTGNATVVIADNLGSTLATSPQPARLAHGQRQLARSG
jgi:hypothetical protein